MTRSNLSMSAAPAALFLLALGAGGCASMDSMSAQADTPTAAVEPAQVAEGDAAPAAETAAAPTQARLEAHIARWPEAAKKAAMAMSAKYGAPQEMTASQIAWRNNGPWLWTRIDNYETPHEFPAHHTDVMEQAINYKLRPDMFDEMAAYDGSVYVRRTEGVMSARCDVEGANFLALNLAHDVATRAKTVPAARTYYARAIAAFKANGTMDPYMQGLRFRASGSTADADMPLGS